MDEDGDQEIDCGVSPCKCKGAQYEKADPNEISLAEHWLDTLRRISKTVEPIMLEAVKREFETETAFEVIEIQNGKSLLIEFEGQRYSVMPMLMGLPE